MAIEIETTGETTTTRQERVSRAGQRAHTECVKRLSKRDLLAGRAETADYGIDRPFALDETYPTTYGECVERRLGGEENPCHFVRCKWHLAIDIHPETGAIKINHPGALDADGALDLRAMPATCALHLSLEEHTLEQVGALINITRERARQIETRGLALLKEIATLARLQDFSENEITRGIKPEDTRPGTQCKRSPAPKPLGRTQPYGRRRYRSPTLQPMDRDRAAAARKVHDTLRAHAEGDDYAAPRIDPASELQSSLAFSVRDGGE